VMDPVLVALGEIAKGCEAKIGPDVRAQCHARRLT